MSPASHVDGSDPVNGGAPPRFSVLMVCYANHCRSPLAELVLAQAADLRLLNWKVSSAGTHAAPGQKMHPSAAEVLRSRGLDTDGWLSRRLQPALVEAADLVLTAGDEQRAFVTTMTPSALSRTFTLLQFAHLRRGAELPRRIAPVDYGPALLAGVRDARGRLQPLPKAERELPDPMGQSPTKFRRCAVAIEQAVEQILAGVPSCGKTRSASVTG
ncbi:MAG TPA: hypothetical protein VEQ66_06385 [Propionibacteriaceae bacterium]|nr:hypothetical protein [Propionibacteriaceae bacterium]